MARLRWLVADADAYTSSLSESPRPEKQDRPSRMNRHFAAKPSPGTRLVAAIAPAFTMGLDLPSGLRSTAARESYGSPVALTPSLCLTSSAPSAWHARARTHGLATLMIAN